MSRVYFHSPSGEAELSGSERAYADILVRDIATSRFSRYHARERYGPLLPPDSYMSREPDGPFWETRFRSWWTGFVDEAHLVIDGEKVSTWHLSLNTALALGSDVLELCARLHATCEIHGYVEGPNRAWLAEIITKGRDGRVLRSDQGWEDVVTLLETRSDEPVVMSYSVTESFPNSWVTEKAGLWTTNDDNPDAWYELSTDEQWAVALRALRTRSGSLEISPEIWGKRGFGNGWSVFDLEEWINGRSTVPA